MTAISPHAGLLRYVWQQGGGEPPSGGVQTRLVAKIGRHRASWPTVYILLLVFFLFVKKPINLINKTFSIF